MRLVFVHALHQARYFADAGRLRGHETLAARNQPEAVAARLHQDGLQDAVPADRLHERRGHARIVATHVDDPGLDESNG